MGVESQEGETMIKKFMLFAFVCAFGCAAVLAQEPAPAEKGVSKEGPKIGQAKPENPMDNTPATDALNKQITDLQQQLKTLQNTLDKLSKTPDDIVELKGKIALVSDDNKSLTDRVKTLEADKKTLESEKQTLISDLAALAKRVQTLEGDNGSLLARLESVSEKMAALDTETQQPQTTKKTAFVKAAVLFHNNENRELQMNVNGTWHTLKPGANPIWVPHGPVHIYRYTGAEPKLFWKWKTYKDGFVMEFDVGTPAKK